MRTVRRYTRKQWERAFGPLPFGFEGANAVWNPNPIPDRDSDNYLTPLDKRLGDHFTDHEMAFLKAFQDAYDRHEAETTALRAKIPWGLTPTIDSGITADHAVEQAIAELQERFAAENAGEVITRGDEPPNPFLEALGQEF